MAACRHEEQEHIAVDPALLPSTCLHLYPDKNTSTRWKYTSQLTLHYCRRCGCTCILTKIHQQGARTHRSWPCTIAVDVPALVSWQKHINNVQEHIAVDPAILPSMCLHLYPDKNTSTTCKNTSQLTLRYCRRCACTCILTAAQSVQLTQAASYIILIFNMFSILSTGQARSPTGLELCCWTLLEQQHWLHQMLPERILVLF